MCFWLESFLNNSKQTETEPEKILKNGINWFNNPEYDIKTTNMPANFINLFENISLRLFRKN